MTLIVDASVAVKWFTAETGHEQAMRLRFSNAPLWSPEFVVVETLNVIWKKLKRGEMSAPQAMAVPEALQACFDRLVPASEYSQSALALARKLDHSVYDCCYLACATLYEAVLVTEDVEFMRKARLHGYGNRLRRLADWESVG